MNNKIKPLAIPEELAKNIIAIYGAQGKKWLEALPEFLVSCEQQWDLQLDSCYQNLSFNYVAPAILSDGTNVVLKCSPANDEFTAEIAALEHFNGIGAAKLLRADAVNGKMLLERLSPGYTLGTLDHAQEAVNISVTVTNQLYKPVTSPFPFPTLQQWSKDFDKNIGPFPKQLMDRARYISQELLASMGEQVLLHGDLHYGNIIFSDERGWLTIDPKGVIGEREFDIPLPKLNEVFTEKQLTANLKFFLEASGFDQQRVLGWLFVKVVLMAWWSFEDAGEANPQFVAFAELVQSVKF